MRDFNHTIGVLVEAYIHGVLEHNNCAACAVGNMIANSLNAKPTTARELGFNCDAKLWVRNGDSIEPLWAHVFCSLRPNNQERDKLKYRGYAKLQIDSTGYTWQELAKIEKAFEGVCDEYYDDDGYRGLMAVVDVLAEIHGIDLKAKEEAKLLFIKQ